MYKRQARPIGAGQNDQIRKARAAGDQIVQRPQLRHNRFQRPAQISGLRCLGRPGRGLKRAVEQGVDRRRNRRNRVQRRCDITDRLGEKLVMAAMRAIDLIGRAQADDRANGRAFLADGGMGRACLLYTSRCV